MNSKQLLRIIATILVMVIAILLGACAGTPAAVTSAEPSHIPISTKETSSPATPSPIETPTPTATPSVTYPKVSNDIYEIQVTEVVTSPLTTGDFVDITVRYVSNDPELALGIGANPSVCGILQDASGSSWTAREIGNVKQEGKVVHAFCGFLIPITATGLEWIVEGYPSVELGF